MAANSELDISALPWRGPGPGRPALALPPQRMPLRRGGRNLKGWDYVGVFANEFLLVGARVRVGPLGQTFWVLWERQAEILREHTRIRLPGARGEVFSEGDLIRIMARRMRADLRLADDGWIECVCATDEGQYVWTRKRADVPVQCDVRTAGSRWRTAARAVQDQSAGYHPRHTVWSWSAGVGRAVDGRSVGWNLVTGINDPPRRSERAIWLDGEPFEPGPVEFQGLEAIAFDDGSRLAFRAECERRRAERLPLVHYSYRQPLGTFTGSLAGVELSDGVGVMEHHDALW